MENETQSSKRWYVIQVMVGFERRAVENLREMIRLHHQEENFGEILFPTEEVVEMKEGKKRITDRKIFPGYVLVQMNMTDETWHLVRRTSRVTGFIGGTSDRPAPLSDQEANAILDRIKEGI